MEFRLLGPLEVLGDDGVTVSLGGPRPRALLALLLLNANEVVSVDRLIDGIWGEKPPASGQSALQVHVHALRQALGADRIVTRPPGYLLRVDDRELDVDRFERLVQDGSLSEALALWRGPALADVAYESFAQAEAARLEESRLAALDARIAADLDAGLHTALISELDALVAAYPHRERLRGHHMLALYRAGRQADALDSFQSARAELRELGLDPSPELRDLQQRILNHDPALALPAAEVAATTPCAPELIGRDVELASVTALLRRDDVRLVTLTGAGGTGKTTLALAAAAGVGGAAFVDLAPIADPELVLPAIGSALGIDEAPGHTPTESIARTLAGGEPTLVLLDNLEHLVASFPEVAGLLDAVPTLRILATSRVPLRIAPELEYRVPPLQVPELGATDPDEVSSSAAVRLYVSPGAGSAARLRAERGERRRARPHHAGAGRAPARDRARRGACSRARCGGDREAPRRGARAPRAQGAGSSRAPAVTAGRDRLERRAARFPGASRSDRPRRFPGWRDPRCPRVGGRSGDRRRDGARGPPRRRPRPPPGGRHG